MSVMRNCTAAFACIGNVRYGPELLSRSLNPVEGIEAWLYHSATPCLDFWNPFSHAISLRVPAGLYRLPLPTVASMR